MLVDLGALKPNPMRDFVVDPIDDDAVERLRASIEEDGFWGGIVCRQTRDGEIQIGAGHHRVKAALLAGLTTADVFVRDADDVDDHSMLRMYARENATQRGNTGTAQTGSVAAALKFVAKAVLSGIAQEFLSNAEIGKVRGKLTHHEGIGQGVIVSFLCDVPGINESVVQQALANLKSSGNYSRIISEVQAEIERENAEAIASLAKAEEERRQAEVQEREAEQHRKEAASKAKAARQEADRKRAELDRQRAEAEAKLAEKRRVEADEQLKQFEGLKKTRDTAAKATEASAKRTKTFDFEGVSKHLKNPHQVAVFREVVTGPLVSPYLSVDKQEAVAEAVVELAKQHGKGELTGQFIKDNIATMVIDVKTTERKMTRQEKERIEQDDAIQRLKDHQRAASGALRSFMTACMNINSRLTKWPAHCPVPITNEFRTTIQAAKKVIDSLIERI